MIEPTHHWAPLAWIEDRWQRDVLFSVDARGFYTAVRPGVPDPVTGPVPGSATEAAAVNRLPGPVLPGVVNAHSHAFQRAIAGLTERASASGDDDFWAWRERMYSAALRLTPEQVHAIACQLYGEMLLAGYTHVCEFHYLHHDPTGQSYTPAHRMGQALIDAAHQVGIGITLLPTLYMRAGFDQDSLREQQRRFRGTVDSVCDWVQQAQAHSGARAGATDRHGVALHSLRAVGPHALQQVADTAAAQGWPVHIHIAEQMQEVRDCLAATGQRPVAWLLDHVDLDARWNLVHATHADAGELAGVARQGASIVICPSTEANLGDGFLDLPTYLGHGGRWSVGSDSHVSRDWVEELRWLEYGQRLQRQRRNVVGVQTADRSTAHGLFAQAQRGAPSATGLPLGTIAVGQRADFQVLDRRSPALAGIPDGHLLDATIFGGGPSTVQAVYVAGRCAVRDRTLVQCADTMPAYLQAMQALWGAH